MLSRQSRPLVGNLSLNCLFDQSQLILAGQGATLSYFRDPGNLVKPQVIHATSISSTWRGTTKPEIINLALVVLSLHLKTKFSRPHNSTNVELSVLSLKVYMIIYCYFQIISFLPYDTSLFRGILPRNIGKILKYHDNNGTFKTAER